jgi:hypothetical protein
MMRLLSVSLERFVALAWCFVLLGCGRPGHDPDVALVGGYVLGSYESGHDDGYFVAKEDKVVISSSVQEVGVIDDKVIGRVEDAMVPTLERIKDGYFILHTSTGAIESGLTAIELRRRLALDTEPQLVRARDWKP